MDGSKEKRKLLVITQGQLRHLQSSVQSESLSFLFIFLKTLFYIGV